MKEREKRGELKCRNFPESPVSNALFEHGSRKFGTKLAWVFLVKCCAVVSCKLDWPRVSVLHVAPTRQLKSFTSVELMYIFSEDFWIDLRSDFTMNSLLRYKDRIKAGVCLLGNDATTWLASKAQRIKDRAVGGLSELFSDGKYVYQDFRQKFSLEGKVTAIFNITSEAYQNYKDRLFGLTFSERFLTVHYVMTQEEKAAWVLKEEISKKMRFHGIITEDDVTKRVEIHSKYLSVIRHLAMQFSYESLNSPVSCQDLIKGTLRAHASLNKRSEVCIDDIGFVVKVRPFLRNPFSPYDGQIVRYRANGLSIREIASKIGKGNYEHHIQQVIKKAEQRGILDLELPPSVGANDRRRQ